jgi:hypothetical protein
MQNSAERDLAIPGEAGGKPVDWLEHVTTSYSSANAKVGWVFGTISQLPGHGLVNAPGLPLLDVSNPDIASIIAEQEDILLAHSCMSRVSCTAAPPTCCTQTCGAAPS